jgi:hypothetical protein
MLPVLAGVATVAATGAGALATALGSQVALNVTAALTAAAFQNGFSAGSLNTINDSLQEILEQLESLDARFRVVNGGEMSLSDMVYVLGPQISEALGDTIPGQIYNVKDELNEIQAKLRVLEGEETLSIADILNLINAKLFVVEGEEEKSLAEILYESGQPLNALHIHLEKISQDEEFSYEIADEA